MPRLSPDYDQNVFINCPFDGEYTPLFNAIVFAVHDAGFRPRCALEANNAGDFRLEKIMTIISECRYSVHDISRTELDRVNALPRFNMPLELGIDLGCRKFGSPAHRRKALLILDRERHRYQKFISDIAGQDISDHGDDPRQAIMKVRDWLRTESGIAGIPGGEKIHDRFRLFQQQLPALCDQLRYDLKNLPFVDLSYTITYWLEEN